MKNRIITIVSTLILVLWISSSTAAFFDKVGDYRECIGNYEVEFDKGNLNGALNEIDKCIERHPEEAYPYYLRAQLLNEMGSWIESQIYAEKYIKIQTDIKNNVNIINEANNLIKRIDNLLKQEKKARYQAELSKLYHLKKPTFLNIGDTRRLVPVQETLLVNETEGKILYPYHDATVDPANLTEGKRVDVTGECPQKGTLCSLNLKVTANLDIEHALLWGDQLPPQSTQIQLQPALSKVYTFTAEIPVDMAAQPFDLILTSRKGQSFKRVLQLQGTQLQITAPKDLSSEL